MRRTAKYKWQDYKTKKDILSELKINPVVNKTHSHIPKRVQRGWRMDRDRQTATLNYEISAI